MENKEYEIIKELINTVVVSDVSSYASLVTIAAYRGQEYLEAVVNNMDFFTRYVNSYKRDKYACIVHTCSYDNRDYIREALFTRLSDMESERDGN